MNNFTLCAHGSVPKFVHTILLPIFQFSEWEQTEQILFSAGITLPYFDQSDFSGKKDEVLYLYDQKKNRKYILLGLGEQKTSQAAKSALLSFRKKNQERIQTNIAISLLFLEKYALEYIINIANGWTLGGYDIGLYQTSKEKIENTELFFLVDDEKDEEVKNLIHLGLELGDTQKSLLDLVNAPSSHKTPVELAAWVEESSKKHQYQCKILEKTNLESIGMHALLAVNRGSEVPAKCLVLEHVPKSYTKTIALIGKGITFDTGGLSIKSSRNMHYMKSDMGGAAATMGAIEMIAKMQLPIRAIGIIPTTDNSVDAKSVKPGDVIESYSGKTIEIIDTDAEGRLVLADGIAYANKQFQPDHIIDSATLTGSIIQALGLQAAGMFSNNDALAQVIQKAGESTGEKVWRMPVWDAYMEDMKSDVADIRNLGDKPYAGSITAAKFLQYFTNEHPSWAHLDIAGMAFGPNSLSKGYSGTAFGIYLLYETVRQLSEA
jgi:leucyl aminopeptidase